MKQLFSTILLLIGLLSIQAQENNPVADPQAVVQEGGARFTVLTPEMIRIQYSIQQKFEDRATFAIVNRRLPVPQFTTERADGYLVLKTSALTLRYKIGSELRAGQTDSEALTITLQLNGRPVVWYPGKDDALNLKGTTRTLDGQIGDNKRQEMENGLLSRAGWSIIDESPRTRRGDGSTTFAFEGQVDGIEWVAEPVDKNAIDWYFMGYGHQYKKALGDYIKVAGRQPMPPLYVLGYWYSKYQRYTSDEFMEIVNDVKHNQIPMDVMIFDMDWHTQGWTGWTWDRTAIPDPEGLIDWMHQQGLKVSLNLHPADGVDDDEDYFAELRDDMGMDAATTKVVPWNLSDGRFYHNMFNRIIRAREKQGVDFWWLDWQQNLTSKYVDGLSETFWCNHVFYNDMRLNRPNHRPLIFHRWGGLGSHRYPIGFSGDSFTTYGTLAWQPYFTATASNVCFGYWGHDLGGHQQTGPNDPEIYLRWMQYGVFTPVFRTHATNWPGIERRIWKYENFPLLLETVKLRYALMPYIYTAARQAYDTGVSICRPLYYEWPEAGNAYQFEDEYMFGDDILVAPIVTESGADGKTARRTWLPEGRWYDVCRGEVVEGNRIFTDSYTQEEIPYFYRAGAVIVNNPPMMNLNTRPDRLILKVVPGSNGQASLYEDEGDTEGYKTGAYTTVRMKNEGGQLTIEPRVGSFPSMPSSRAYTVEFLSTKRPASVLINGEKQGNGVWNYNQQTKTTTVYVPNTPCNQQITIRRLDI